LALFTGWLTGLIAFAGRFREMGLEFAGHAVKLLGIGGRVALDGNVWPLGGVVGVDLEPRFEAGFGVRLDRVSWAFRLANATINAFIGVDDQHVFTFVEAVHGADFNAIHIFALNAVFSDDVGHGGPLVLYNERLIARFFALCTVFFTLGRGRREVFV
jgi:hypothetical protein